MYSFSKAAFGLAIFSSVSCFGMVRVLHDGKAYRVSDATGEHKVKSYDVEEPLNKFTASQYKKFIEVGNKVRAVKLSNGDYVIRPDGGLNGGGFGLAIAAYYGIQATVIAACVAFPPAAVVIAPVGQVLAGVAAAALAVTPTP